jgi:hypothetical protein
VISTKGFIYFQVLKGNNKAPSFRKFLIDFEKMKTRLDPNFKSRALLLLDNASIHGTPEVKQHLNQSGIKYKFSGVCQCPAAPVEFIIGQIKKKFFKMMVQ